jgi:glucose/arabinose dehydrogenase
MTRSSAALLICAACASFLTACGSSVPTATPTTTSASGSGPSASGSVTTGPEGSPLEVHLRAIADLDAPLAMAVRAGDPALYVAEQGGRVIAIRGGTPDPTPVLDVSGQVTSGGERGLLGLTFSPDGRFLYVDFTDLDGNTNVIEYRMDADGRADAGSRREILFVEQPFANHNGGDLVFGPDGDLYVGLGDGGSGGDPHRNGQDLGTLLAKMLRIEPRMPDGSLPPGGRAYAIPPNNPFVDRPGARPEIWAYGLRNPWRYSFDRDSGDLWIGDVGQNAWEEVDLQPTDAGGGQNYGWNLTEGFHPYGNVAAPPANWTRPLFDRSHDDGYCALIGGYVYRGAASPALDGVYLYTDECAGELRGVVERGGRVVRAIDLGVHVDTPVSFGQDADGELYVISLAGPVYRLVP